MAIGTYALTTVDKVKNYLRLSNETLYANGLSVQGTGDGTNLILIYDTTSGATTANLALGTYTTISTLAAAVAATSGWSTVDMGMGSYLSAGLCQSPAFVATDEYCYFV